MANVLSTSHIRPVLKNTAWKILGISVQLQVCMQPCMVAVNMAWSAFAAANHAAVGQTNGQMDGQTDRWLGLALYHYDLFHLIWLRCYTYLQRPCQILCKQCQQGNIAAVLTGWRRSQTVWHSATCVCSRDSRRACSVTECQSAAPMPAVSARQHPCRCRRLCAHYAGLQTISPCLALAAWCTPVTDKQHHRLQWSSGRVLNCGVQRPRFKSHCRWFYLVCLSVSVGNNCELG